MAATGEQRKAFCRPGQKIHSVSHATSYCMDAPAAAPHHAPVRVLPHIKRLDECFGDFLVRVTSPCGTSRHIEPEALARIAGRS